MARGPIMPHHAVPVHMEPCSRFGVMNGHHDHEAWLASSQLTRSLWWVIGVWALATTVGILALWPSGGHQGTGSVGRSRARRSHSARRGCAALHRNRAVARYFVQGGHIRRHVGSILGTTAVLEFGVSQSSAKVPDVGDDV